MKLQTYKGPETLSRIISVQDTLFLYGIQMDLNWGLIYKVNVKDIKIPLYHYNLSLSILEITIRNSTF